MKLDDKRIAEVRDYPGDTYIVFFENMPGWIWSADGLTGSTDWRADPSVIAGFDTHDAAMAHAARQLDLREGTVGAWIPDEAPMPEAA